MGASSRPDGPAAFPLSHLRQRKTWFVLVALLLGAAMVSWEMAQTDRIDAAGTDGGHNEETP